MTEEPLTEPEKRFRAMFQTFLEYSNAWNLQEVDEAAVQRLITAHRNFAALSPAPRATAEAGKVISRLTLHVRLQPQPEEIAAELRLARRQLAVIHGAVNVLVAGHPEHAKELLLAKQYVGRAFDALANVTPIDPTLPSHS